MHFGYAFAAAVMQIQVAQHREQQFRKSLEGLPEHMQAEAIRRHLEQLEKERQEATAERRHQEMLEAIRSNRPWYRP